MIATSSDKEDDESEREGEPDRYTTEPVDVHKVRIIKRFRAE